MEWNDPRCAASKIVNANSPWSAMRQVFGKKKVVPSSVSRVSSAVACSPETAAATGLAWLKSVGDDEDDDCSVTSSDNNGRLSSGVGTASDIETKGKKEEKEKERGVSALVVLLSICLI